MGDRRDLTPQWRDIMQLAFLFALLMCLMGCAKPPPVKKTVPAAKRAAKQVLTTTARKAETLPKEPLHFSLDDVLKCFVALDPSIPALNLQHDLLIREQYCDKAHDIKLTIEQNPDGKLVLVALSSFFAYHDELKDPKTEAIRLKRLSIAFGQLAKLASNDIDVDQVERWFLMTIKYPDSRSTLFDRKGIQLGTLNVSGGPIGNDMIEAWVERDPIFGGKAGEDLIKND